MRTKNRSGGINRIHRPADKSGEGHEDENESVSASHIYHHFIDWVTFMLCYCWLVQQCFYQCCASILHCLASIQWFQVIWNGEASADCDRRRRDDGDRFFAIYVSDNFNARA